MKKYATQLPLLSLFLFLILTSCQPEPIGTTGDETIPATREAISTQKAPVFEIGPETPFEKNQYGEVIVTLPVDNADLVLRFAFPDVPTYQGIVRNGAVKYDLGDFKFAVNRAEINGRDIVSHIGNETYMDLVASIERGDLPFPMSSGNVLGRGLPTDESKMTPVIDVIHSPVVAEMEVGEVEDQTDSNCPYVFGCSGDCAFAIKIDGTWYLAEGDCRRTKLIVCYCHTTKITPSGVVPVGK